MNNSNCLPNREANAADFKTQNINNCKVTKYTRAGKLGTDSNTHRRED